MSRNHKRRSLWWTDPFKKATETHWAAQVLNQTLKYVLILPSRPWCNAAHQVETTVTTNTSAAVLSHSSTAARWEEAGRRIFRLDSQNQAATFHHFTRTQQQSLWKTVKCERARGLQCHLRPECNRAVGVFVLRPGEQTVGLRFWQVYWSTNVI